MTRLGTVMCIVLMLCAPAATQSNSDDRGPDLSGSWPTTMTLEVLKEAGLVDAGQIDSTWTDRLASERSHKHVWHQLYLVQFKMHTGSTVEAIAVIEESTMADMRSGPVVYVVSKVLQPEGKAEPPRR